MTDAWNASDVRVGMPHLAPGGKLSEVELFKLLADLQWQSIAGLLGQRSEDIANEAGERLYASVIDCELCLGERHSLESFGEGAHLALRNRVRVYAKRFVEGLCAIENREVPDELLQKVSSAKDLASWGGSWASITNAFIAPEGSNQKLVVFKPAGIDALEIPALDDAPAGILEHAQVQSTGEIGELDDPEPSRAMLAQSSDRIRYTVLPESDLNGAGLVYFARYLAMLNYGERIFLGDHLERPVSSNLTAGLSTEHRRIFFFANANSGEQVEVAVKARLVPPESFRGAPGPERYRTPFKLIVRGDLYRGSDGVLMASSLVRKALRVPADAKAVLAEAERLLRVFN